MLNAIYATCVNEFDNDTIVIEDNFFEKTKKNILAGSKGSIEYHKEGAFFEDMKRWNPTQHPGHAAAVVKVEEIYSGSKKLL